MTTDMQAAPAGGQVEAARILPVRANWGRWVADCATFWCTNAWMPDLHQQMWRCSTCGLDTEITWPVDPVAIEAVLLMRVNPNDRNWEPGETVTDLLLENIEHGVPVQVPDQQETCDLLIEVGGQVVGGLIREQVEQWRAVRAQYAGALASGRFQLTEE